MTTPSEFLRVTHERLHLRAAGEEALGIPAWSLLFGYGRLMSGPFSGLYLSGVPTDVAREVLNALLSGEVVNVHLMHRHQSGNYESSRLTLRDGKLVMLFPDRSVQAI